MKIYFSKSKAVAKSILDEIYGHLKLLEKEHTIIEYGGNKWMGDPIKKSDILLMCLPNWVSNNLDILNQDAYMGKGQHTELETFLEDKQNAENVFIITRTIPATGLIVSQINTEGKIKVVERDWKVTYAYVTLQEFEYDFKEILPYFDNRYNSKVMFEKFIKNLEIRSNIPNFIRNSFDSNFDYLKHKI